LRGKFEEEYLGPQKEIKYGESNFKLWHPRCVLITVYKEWYQVVKHNYIYLAIWWR